MKVLLLKQFGMNAPGMVMDLPQSSCELLIQRGAARPLEETTKTIETKVENTSMKRAKVERKQKWQMN